MNIIYVGATFVGSSSLSRAHALKSLGHDVRLVEAGPYERGLARVVYGFRRKTGWGLAHPSNGELRRLVRANHPDIVWFDKALNTTPRTLLALIQESSRPRLVHYSLDDHAISGNVSRDLIKSLPLFDLVVTTKTHNVKLLESMKCRNVLMSWQGYDDELHRPPLAHELDVTLTDRILFIGAWEETRARTIEQLVAADLPVTVISAWPQWRELQARYRSFELRNVDIYGRAYGVALGSAAIGLGFLRKQARDQHTQRSVEIPACGSVLIAERTPEHQQLFADGKEAFFFSSDSECVDLCRSLLADPTRRHSVTTAARERCIRDGYSWKNRVRQILECTVTAAS